MTIWRNSHVTHTFSLVCSAAHDIHFRMQASSRRNSAAAAGQHDDDDARNDDHSGARSDHGLLRDTG
jgi:hypothetical protein